MAVSRPQKHDSQHRHAQNGEQHADRALHLPLGRQPLEARTDLSADDDPGHDEGENPRHPARWLYSRLLSARIKVIQVHLIPRSRSQTP